MIKLTKEKRTTNLLKGICIVAMYFIFSFYRNLPLELLHIKYDSLNILTKEIYNISLELLMLVIIYLVFEEQILNAWKDLKKNHMKYFSENFKYYLVGLILMFGSNVLINILGGGISTNEETIRNQFTIAPIFTYISAVFLAPILEESVFRLSFRNIFKNNFLFIVASGLIFGGLHLLAGVDANLFALYLISYCSFGVIFAYMLVKTNNIFVSMGFHLMHNGILMTLQLILFIFT
ncbi:MAG: CPBP family intramembrane metalloprotease [Bacilli bacterium]|nr:CPBP family intramembrane metalloprotease [Bacilli bacterium]